MVEQQLLVFLHYEMATKRYEIIIEKKYFAMRTIQLLTIFVSFTMCFASNMTESNIVLQSYGTYPVNGEDNVLVFYVTLTNDGNASVVASVSMIECCEQILSNPTPYCDHMRLDGTRLPLDKKRTTNYKLFYSNAYPYNRKGKCTVNITLYNNDQLKIAEASQYIHFDTTILPEDIFLLQESILNVENKFKLCKSPDEDPLNSCEPVNCHMKYQGHRSFYDYDLRQCIPIPVCNGKNNTNSANLAYDPFGNDCVPLTDNTPASDIEAILYGRFGDDDRGNKPKKPVHRSNVRCHHGTLNETTEACECYDGWTTAAVPPVDRRFPASFVSTIPVHQCTVRRRFSSPAFLSVVASQNLGKIMWAFVLFAVWYLILQLVIACLVVNL